MIKLSIGGFDFTPIFIVRSDGQRSSLFARATEHNVNLVAEKKLTKDGNTVIYIDSHFGDPEQTATDVQAFIKELATHQRKDWIQDRGFIKDGERALMFWHKEAIS